MKPYTISKQEYVRVQRGQMVKGLRRTLPLLIVLLAVLSMGKSRGTIISVAWPLLLGVAIGIYILNKKLKDNYGSYKAIQKEYSIAFDESTISWSSEMGHTQRSWTDFMGYKMLKEMTLLFETKQLMYMIPHRAFENDNELDLFHGNLTKIR